MKSLREGWTILSGEDCCCRRMWNRCLRRESSSLSLSFPKPPQIPPLNSAHPSLACRFALLCFHSFFTLLNPASCQLDSRVHTPDFVQQTSPVLFTAVLCVAAKVERPDLYPPLLIHANSLVAKGFAEDLVTVEFVSSISLLSFWKPSHVSREG